MRPTDRAAEAARQNALLRVLRRQRGSAPDWVHTAAQLHDEPDLHLHPATLAGLGAYQAHARAVCQRALAAACPTVQALLGEEALGQLAWRLWGTHPLRHGDLGRWGHGLPALLTDDPDVAAQLAAWPWLADVARLDLAVHDASRRAAWAVDAAALQALAQADLQRTLLVLQPHVQLVCSPWPLGALWQAHRVVPDDATLAAAHALLRAGPVPADATGALPGWVAWWHPDGHVDVAGLSAAEARWMQQLGATPAIGSAGSAGSPGGALADQLAQAHPALDFSAWWLRALRHGWLAGTASV